MRKLVLGGATYLWRVTHRHHVEAGGACQELFTAYLDGHPRAPLRVRFTEGASHGAEYVRRAGLVQAYDDALPTWNLNQPATARAVIERGLAQGWAPAGTPRALDIGDGWSFIRAVPP